MIIPIYKTNKRATSSLCITQQKFASEQKEILQNVITLVHKYTPTFKPKEL